MIPLSVRCSNPESPIFKIDNESGREVVLSKTETGLRASATPARRPSVTWSQVVIVLDGLIRERDSMSDRLI